MRTSLSDLNEYLFEMLDRITNDDLTDEQLQRQISIADTTVKVAKTIIDSDRLVLDAKKHFDEYGEGENLNVKFLE